MRRKNGLHVKGFNKDLKYFNEQFRLKNDQLLRKVALDIFSDVLKQSPVDYGVFRASWVLGVNALPKDPKIPHPPRRKKGEKSAPIPPPPVNNSKLSTAKLGDTIIIANHLPYARVIEYGEFPGQGPKTTADGYSTQAPQGVVRAAVQRVASKFRQVKRKVLK